MTRRLAISWLSTVPLCVAALGCGCCSTPPPDNGQTRPPPAAAALIAMHNRNVSRIDTLWARSVLQVEWVDDKGKTRLEQGEGHLTLDLPSKSALTIGKIGEVKLWAGSDDEHYWLFDTINVSTLYLGRRDGDSPASVAANAPKVAQSPLPVNTTDMPQLLGIVPIAADAEATVSGEGGLHVLTIPAARIRYYFNPKHYISDPANYLPSRIELLDDKGEPAVIASLTNAAFTAADNAALGPLVSTRIEVALPARQSRLVLHLHDPSAEADKVKDKMFDLEFLKRLMAPRDILHIVPPAR